MRKSNTILLSEILERFELVDDELVWTNNFGSRARKGNKVGSVNSHGYMVVGICGKVYQLSRIKYQIYNNVEILDDTLFVDHIDHNPLNNSSENLRLVSQSQNSMNRLNKKRIGLKNITFLGRGNLPYSVRIRKDNVTTEKCFGTIEEAILYRDVTIKNIHGEFSCEL